MAVSDSFKDNLGEFVSRVSAIGDPDGENDYCGATLYCFHCGSAIRNRSEIARVEIPGVSQIVHSQCKSLVSPDDLIDYARDRLPRPWQ